MTADRPVLITDAQRSYEDQYAARKRRYATIMGMRLLLFVLGGLAYPVSPWLAVALLALSVPLPWIAVLGANDAPARRTEDTHRLGAPTPVRQIEARSHVVIDEGVIDEVRPAA